MKYTLDIEINLPLAKVHELFDNPDNMHKWQPSLKAFEMIDGKPGQAGSKSRLHYKIGKRNLEMIETITKNDLPKELTATYETKGV
ncbi:MAG: SRPBCC family protein, partial [Reichenbachiella sp.]